MKKNNEQLDLPYEGGGNPEKEAGDLKLEKILAGLIKIAGDDLKVNMYFIQQAHKEYFGETKAVIDEKIYFEFVEKIVAAMKKRGFEISSGVNSFLEGKNSDRMEEAKRNKRLEILDEEDNTKPEAWGAGAGLPKSDR